MLLLVAEKPSVATQHYRAMLERCEGESFVQRDGYLQGKNHCITWCVGHLITLAPFDQYPGFDGPWRLANLPMLPKQFLLQPIERTSKQLHIVQGLMAQAETIVNGADAGREGNLIFDLILDYTPAFKQKKIQRLWVNSYVAKELDVAWKKLESAEQRVNLSYAARLRQRADWMVGLNATRAYTLTAGQGKLISVGRVQTPTLNLIVQRDDQVENFQEHFFYGVVGHWNGFPAQWIREEKIAFFDEDRIPKSIVEKCANQLAVLQSSEIKKKSQFPPKPFDLTELQKEANKRFKMNVQEVLDIAQVLYEKKVLTYPRTDSSYLPESMQRESYQLAQTLATAKQKEWIRPESDSFVFINSSKVTDHYAIIPTGEKAQGLSETEQKVYHLVVERFVLAWTQPYVWSEYEALIQCQQEEFRLKLKKPEQEGFKALVKEDKKVKKANSETSEDEIANEVDAFPSWANETTAIFDPIELHKKKKSKPKYFTEATLLAAMKTAGKQIDDDDMAEAMKDRGLGTPATQAGIIETLKKREFISTQKTSIVSTKRGREVIALMDDKVKSPEMTGEWEYKLSLVEKGSFDPAAFRDGIVDYVQQLFSSLQQRYGNQFAREKAQSALPCPKCGQDLSMPPWGYVCKNGVCDFRIGHTVAQRSITHEEMAELLRNRRTGVLQGFVSKKGNVFAAALVLDETAKAVFEFPERKSTDHEGTNTPIFPCSCCGFSMKKSAQWLYCADPQCGYVLPLVYYGKALDDSVLLQLLTQKHSEVLDGFVKGDTAFRAALEIRSDGKIGFDLSSVVKF